MGEVVWSQQAEADLENIDPAIRQQLRRNARETLHVVHAVTAHEGVSHGIMWHRGTTHEQAEQIEEEWPWEEEEWPWEEDDDDGEQAWNYFLFYRQLNPEGFEVLAVRHVRDIARRAGKWYGPPEAAEY